MVCRAFKSDEISNYREIHIWDLNPWLARRWGGLCTLVNPNNLGQAMRAAIPTYRAAIPTYLILNCKLYTL